MATNKMDAEEFQFPDEKEQASAAADNFEIEIEDDTPEEDRDRQPLPKEMVDELEDDELEEYSDGVKTRLKQMKKVWHDERRAKDQALREQQEAISYAKQMQEENRALKGRLSTGEQHFIDTYKSAAELELDNAKRDTKTPMTWVTLTVYWMHRKNCLRLSSKFRKQKNLFRLDNLKKVMYNPQQIQLLFLTNVRLRGKSAMNGSVRMRR
jgi:hypothetical protein